MRLAVLFVAMLLAAAPSPASAQARSHVDYADPKSWLCLPGRDDACAQRLTSSVIGAGGATKRTYRADANAPVDCFYVYPTVSREPAGNADMTEGPEERRAALQQLARFGEKCRLYAPLYRQVTIAGLNGAATDEAEAFDDVADAWAYYLAHDNRGRGVVLIGHSQGSNILVRLIADQIDGKPLQRRLVSAIVPGTEVDVPAGRDAGGTFQHVPLCRSAAQFGCVIAYSTYLASAPPGADAYFGAARTAGDVDACVDPAQLTGGGALDAELPALGRVAEALGTTLVENPGQLTAACERRDGRSFLAVTVSAGAPLLAAALEAVEARRPQAGLHVFDVNLALGNLVSLVGSESTAWLAAHPGGVAR